MSDLFLEALASSLRERLADFPTPLDVRIWRATVYRSVDVHLKVSNSRFLCSWFLNDQMHWITREQAGVLWDLADPTLPDLVEHTAQYLWEWWKSIRPPLDPDISLTGTTKSTG